MLLKNFAALLLPVSEKDLEREWVWKDHDEEGIRFAFFVTMQELRQLAVQIASHRKRLTQAQHILGQYHKQYMDLQAAIFGLSRKISNVYLPKVNGLSGGCMHIFWAQRSTLAELSAMRWKVTAQAGGILNECQMRTNTSYRHERS